MEKKFKVLRAIGTIWKILAWLVLIVGILSAIGILITGLLGRGLMGWIDRGGYGPMPRMPLPLGALGSVAAFAVSLIITLFYFLGMYAVGELIFLLLAIEENTRRTAQWIQAESRPAPTQPSPPAPAA